MVKKELKHRKIKLGPQNKIEKFKYSLKKLIEKLDYAQKERKKN